MSKPGLKRIGRDKPDADDKQTKISSFFQNGSSKNNGSSKLFSTINQKSGTVAPANKTAKLSLSRNKKSKTVQEHTSSNDHHDSDIILVDSSPAAQHDGKSFHPGKETMLLQAMDSSKGSPQTSEQVLLSGGASELENVHKEIHKESSSLTSHQRRDYLQTDKEDIKVTKLSVEDEHRVERRGKKEKICKPRENSQDLPSKHLVVQNSEGVSKCATSYADEEKSGSVDEGREQIVNATENMEDQEAEVEGTCDALHCSTPVKCDTMETTGIESPDIVFETPQVVGKKVALLNRNLFFASDYSSIGSDESNTGEESRESCKPICQIQSEKLSSQTKDCFRLEEKMCVTKGELRLHEEQLSGRPCDDNVTDLHQVSTKNGSLPLKIKTKILKLDSADPLHSEPATTITTLPDLHLYNVSEESFQPTAMKSPGDELSKKMYRTSSDSKLLNALRLSEINVQEREIEQKLKEKIFEANVMLQHECLEPSNVLESSDVKEKGLSTINFISKSKPRTQSSYFFGDSNTPTKQEGSVYYDKDVIESIKPNRQFESKDTSKKFLHAASLEKKVKKFTPKFTEDFHRQCDGKGGKQEATLKDDPILQQLMSQLSPSGRDKENCNRSSKYPQTNKEVVKSHNIKHISGKLNKNVCEKNSSLTPVLNALLSLEESTANMPSSESLATKHTSCEAAKTKDANAVVIDDSPNDETTILPLPRTTSEDSQRNTQSAKRKRSDSESSLSPCEKRVARNDENFIVIDDKGHENCISASALMESDHLPSDQGTSRTATMSLKIPTVESPPFIDLTSESDVVPEEKTLTSKNASSSSSLLPLTSASSYLSSADCHPSVCLEQNQLTAAGNSDFKTPSVMVTDNEYPKKCQHSCQDKSVPNKIANNCHMKSIKDQTSDLATLDIDDSFYGHDDSLLLAAAGSAVSETSFPTISVFSNEGADARSKSDFCFTQAWQRFVVKTVCGENNKGEKHISLSKERQSSASHQCVLKGFWVETQVKEGDIVNVLADFDDGHCVITDTRGFLVVNPDVLMSGTAVVSSVFCMRKSVLNEIVKSQDVGSTHMLYGRFLHSLFQAVLKDCVTQKSEIVGMAKTLLSSSKFLHEMYSNSVSESQVWQEVNEYIPSLISWVSQHTESGESERFTKEKKAEDIIVTDVQDIEENIWSPKFGLKGKIDLTVKVRSRGTKTNRVLPLELKTGRASFSAEHKGQVILYSMMYGDRREEPGEGILLYLKHSQMEMVKVKPQSQSGLIQLRNSMSSYLSRIVEQTQSGEKGSAFRLGHLPEPINNARGCTKCPHLLTCSMYQKSVENRCHPDRHAMKQLSADALSHLDEMDLEYFKHWALCLSLENHVAGKTKLKEIWTMSSQEREKRGDCLRNLVVVRSDLGIQETQGFTEGKGCSLTFVKSDSHSQDSPRLDAVGLGVNDHVVVSSEDGRLIALATGFIRNISPDLVEVVVDRDNLHDTSSYSDKIFRIDRNDSFSTHGTLLANVSRLMEATPHAAKMRSLIIKQTPPSFEMKIPMPWVKKIKPIFQNLNKPQKSAILKVLMCKDYIIIRGYPGAGKTSTIVALVKVLNALNLSVLLTSYTHSAVDNILLKLKKDGVHFLRLGRQSRIHSGILASSAEILTTKLKSVQELSDFYASYNIVATSCLGMNHPLFIRRRFDVCIVDEASQVLQPACLGPLFSCDKFILVGDGHQLPPLVQSQEARQLGMDESLFSRLENSGATYDLNLQYRMNETIMAVSNKLIYGGRLKCGSTDVAKRCLDVDTSLLQDSPLWLSQALAFDLKKSVSFIDTGKTSGADRHNSKGASSEVEADVVIALLEALVKINVDCTDIGVISPYRSQVKLLQHKRDSEPTLGGIEVNTVDQYQGRDKGVIIVSFVYSSDSGIGGELLTDVRRLNVALTRAKCKLILVGNAQALRSFDHFGSLLTDLEESDCFGIDTKLGKIKGSSGNL